MRNIPNKHFVVTAISIESFFWWSCGSYSPLKPYLQSACLSVRLLIGFPLPAVGPTVFYPLGKGASLPRGKSAGREPNHLPSASEGKNMWIYNTAAPRHFFMA
jgi:hypothetical protein